MNRKNISIGLIGCGSIAEIGILPHLKLHGISISALCDTSQGRLDLLGEKFGATHLYTDLDHFLTDSGVDAVLIATPIILHYQQAMACLSAGKHTYIQKTMTETSAQAKALLSVAKSKSLNLGASPGQILLPANSHVKSLLEAESIGAVYSAISLNWAPGHEHEPTRNDTSNPALDPSWYYKKGGGPLADMGIYSIHSMIDLFGAVREVFAYANRPVTFKQWGDKHINVEALDNYTVSLKFTNGMIAQLLTGFCANPALMGWGSMTIVGSNGSIELRRKPGEGSIYEVFHSGLLGTDSCIREFGSGLASEHDAIGEAHVGLDIIDFIESVSESRPPAASAQTAYHAICVLEAVAKSTESNHPQTV